jgi:hypothetical protein
MDMTLDALDTLDTLDRTPRAGNRQAAPSQISPIQALTQVAFIDDD